MKEKKKQKLNLKRLSVVKEPLKNGTEQREACVGCKRSQKSTECFRMPRVPEGYTRKLLVVTGGSENSRARFFLRKLWRRAGWKDEDVAVYPGVRCDSGRDPSMAQIRACRPFLLQVLSVLKPENVIGVGSVAMRALRNVGEESITKNRGKEISIPGIIKSGSPDAGV